MVYPTQLEISTDVQLRQFELLQRPYEPLQDLRYTILFDREEYIQYRIKPFIALIAILILKEH